LSDSQQQKQETKLQPFAVFHLVALNCAEIYFAVESVLALNVIFLHSTIKRNLWSKNNLGTSRQVNIFLSSK